MYDDDDTRPTTTKPAPVETTTTVKGHVLTRPHAPKRVTTEVFALAVADAGPTRILGANPNRCRALVQVTGTVVIGGREVTAASGFPGPSTFALELKTTEALYALCTAGNGTVAVLTENYDG